MGVVSVFEIKSDNDIVSKLEAGGFLKKTSQNESSYACELDLLKMNPEKYAEDSEDMLSKGIRHVGKPKFNDFVVKFARSYLDKPAISEAILACIPETPILM